MKFLKRLLITAVILFAIGLGLYYFGTNLIADKMMTQVSKELETSGQLESMKQEVLNDPQVQAFIAEGKAIESKDLPFQTKEQATRLLLKKFSVNEITEIQEKARTGMTEEEKQLWFNKVQDRLTEEEMIALKVIAYKELME